ncbi:pentatricopeptide repeat-containing protein At4g16835, mitochondrial [Abrus precatorius]|uniref:Pentatricopeptide repeat-containing protein At4g16835, mitochondrial n=1 Tax=Abrus precatorius TaxID=3816 RepID=A0A8B8JWP7_ABRPR|nr:pentatricopeptide repeat-containing protein At4g16835, mitochondrial [Abrus precatorius]
MYCFRLLRKKKQNLLSTSFFVALSKHQTLTFATTTHQHVLSHTHQREINYVIASNKLITSYVRGGDIDSAFRVFENMKVKSTVSWNSMLSAFAKKPGNFEHACQVFEKIPQPNTVSYNIMLACRLHHFGVDNAREFFDSMLVKDSASWNTMISGYAQVGLMGEARRLFVAMPEKNCVSWSAMVSGYVGCGDLDSAVECFYAANVRSVITWTAMITGYLKFGRVELAERLFRDMSMKTLVTWNAMIAGYVENGRAEDGLKIFKTMLETGVKPNALSLTSVLLGCSNLSALQLGKQVHQLVCKSPLSSDTTAGTSLISMYYKCGDLNDAWELFVQIPQKDVVCWNAMISGYAQHGAGEKALHLFDKMKSEDMKPDWITFVAVLLACNHAGLVDLGVEYFKAMVRDFRIETKPEHYACMVDLLGRAGKLSEAVDLIKSMPFKPHPAIFGTLLGACRIHKNLHLAEFAAKNLLELDPTSATGYVQLANVYAAQNRWDQVARIRRSMKENNVVKIPGYSWIEINSVVHEFRSSDRLHPELASIHEKLNKLEKKMKLAGYVPDLEFALHDVGEELKEQLLLWHSEKLAIAFGLLKVPLGVPILVFKNLRVCGDCHSAIKYISAIEGREIIVRDTIRFHHFKDGLCSCRDYW